MTSNYSTELKTSVYPNPFDNQVNISYALREPSKVTIEIYSIVGTKMKTIKCNYETTWMHETMWDGTDDAGEKIAKGSYIYIVKAGNKQCYGKLLLMYAK